MKNEIDEKFFFFLDKIDEKVKNLLSEYYREKVRKNA